MKRTILPILLLSICLMVPLQISAQSLTPVDLAGIDLDTVDFSGARLSIAGPGAFLIRHVGVGADYYSVIFRESEGNWAVSELLPETGTPILPENVILDFATVEITAAGLEIDGIIIDGVSYSTTLALGENDLLAPATLSSAKFVGASLSRINDDGGLFTPEQVNTQTAQIASLQGRNDELEQRNIELVEQVGELNSWMTGLEDAKKNLEESIARVEAENIQLNSELTTLRAQVEYLNGELSRAEAELSDALAEIASNDSAEMTSDEAGADSGSTEVSGTEAQVENSDTATPDSPDSVTDLPAITDVLVARIDVLLEKIALLEAKLDEVKNSTIATVPEAPVEPTSDTSSGASSSDFPSGSDVADETIYRDYLEKITELEETVRTLRRENDTLLAERNEIEQQVRRKFLNAGYIAAVRDEFSQVSASGFTMAEPQLGSWDITETSASQTNSGEFFAKLELPVEQDGSDMLYRFDARTTGRGWVGFGMHLYASGSDKKGYGYGESLLLWFTRDPQRYGTNRTYLEVYRSSDDINMERVLSAVVTEDISQWMQVEVLYQPMDEYLTVAVDGEEKLRYKTWFDIAAGVGIALRTLDVADFRNLLISTASEIDE